MRDGGSARAGERHDERGGGRGSSKEKAKAAKLKKELEGQEAEESQALTAAGTEESLEAGFDVVEKDLDEEMADGKEDEEDLVFCPPSFKVDRKASNLRLVAAAGAADGAEGQREPAGGAG